MENNFYEDPDSTLMSRQQNRLRAALTKLSDKVWPSYGLFNKLSQDKTRPCLWVATTLTLLREQSD